MEPIRAAIVGTGNIARFHAEALQGLGHEVRIVGATDVDEEHGAAFCARYGIPSSYTDLADMLTTERPALVHVCTPPGTHREQAEKCLRAGASVLVEKPPTLTLREFDALAALEGPPGHEDTGDAGDAGGPWVATVFQHRFGSGAKRLRAMVSSGVLGRPLLAICNTTWFRDQSYFDVDWRGRWDTEGGGPTMGHGIHQMDLLASIFGDWVEVSALARRQARTMETEDLSLAHITFANSAVATVVNSVLSPREESYLRFDFERATVEVNHLYGYGDDNWRITPAPGFSEQVYAAWETGEWGQPSGHSAQIASVAASLRAGERPQVTSVETGRTMRLVAGIYASAFERRPVTPGELGPGSPFFDRMQGSGPRW